jgi:hypothetical protein
MRRSRLHHAIKILCRLALLKRVIYKTFSGVEADYTFRAVPMFRLQFMFVIRTIENHLELNTTGRAIIKKL